VAELHVVLVLLVSIQDAEANVAAEADLGCGLGFGIVCVRLGVLMAVLDDHQTHPNRRVFV
jgi:hypothetical protein